jgi:LPS-assembly lipoprotein
MLWFRAWVLLLGLAACGFTPAFAPSGAANALYGRIAINDTTTRNGFEFIQYFEQRLGRATDPRYDLTVTIATSSTTLGISPSGATTRYNLAGSATWVLTDRTTGAKSGFGGRG